MTRVRPLVRLAEVADAPVRTAAKQIKITPSPNRTKAWRALRASAVAEAEARKREEGAA